MIKRTLGSCIDANIYRISSERNIFSRNGTVQPQTHSQHGVAESFSLAFGQTAYRFAREYAHNHAVGVLWCRLLEARNKKLANR